MNADEFLNSCHIQTRTIHTGYKPSPDVTQPIHLSTTFKRTDPEVVGDYTRSGNPNRKTLEKKLAMLEGGYDALAFGSGMAAINAIFESILKSGDHVIYPDDCYHGARALLKNIFSDKGIDTTEVDMSRVENIAMAINSKTRLIWLETPSNPQLKITDIAAAASLARSKGIVIGCDSTFATPLLQQPIALGIDMVMHSSTKFFSGHSDILGGAVIVREQGRLLDKLRMYQSIAGAVPSPFDCWMLNRSLATLSLRVNAQNDNAMKVATFLAGHNKIEKVFYPGLPSHLNHDVARRQMKNGFGSILSVLVKGGQADALELTRRLKVINHATSLGGIETLIEHRRSAEGSMPVSPDNLLRISVGIEHHEDLIRDFEQALS